MKPKSTFVISEFTNPSGEIVHRVSGWLDGKRVRKNYPSRAEAEAERQVLEVQRLQTDVCGAASDGNQERGEGASLVLIRETLAGSRRPLRDSPAELARVTF